MNIDRIADEYLLKSNIWKLPISLKELISLCEDEGYEVFSYSRAARLIQSCGLQKYTELDAFTYSSEKVKVIFYDDALSYSEKVISLAHELGHIVLMHTSCPVLGKSADANVQSMQEQEADAFALELLAPLCILRNKNVSSTRDIEKITLLGREQAEKVLALLMEKPENDDLEQKLVNQLDPGTTSPHPFARRKKRALSILLAVLSILLIGIVWVLPRQPEDRPFLSESTYSAEIPQSQEPVSSSFSSAITGQQEMWVWVTPDGERYHKADCQYIENSDHAYKTTLQEAEKGGYTPCKVCKP